MRTIAVLALVALAGCVDLKASYPDRRFYTLEATRSASVLTTMPESVLRVRRFTASKLCDTSELVSRTGDTTYDSDFYNVMFVPPAMQVGEQTQRWLTGTQRFSTVVGNGSSMTETHILEGNLVAMHGDYRGSDAPRAVIEIQFLLMRVTSDPAKVLLQKSYRQEVVLLKPEPDRLVKGWSAGLERILTELDADLAKLKL